MWLRASKIWQFSIEKLAGRIVPNDWQIEPQKSAWLVDRSIADMGSIADGRT